MRVFSSSPALQRWVHGPRNGCSVRLNGLPESFCYRLANRQGTSSAVPQGPLKTGALAPEVCPSPGVQWLQSSWISQSLFPKALTAVLATVLAAGVPSGPRTAAAQTAPGADSGVFAIRSNGTGIGTERFQIRQTDAGWEATGELRLQVPGSPEMLETSALRMDRDWKPIGYERRQQAPQKGTLTAAFKAEGTLLTLNAEGGSLDQIFLLPEEVVVLDTNFFHQYSVLLRQFDTARTGTQSLNVFVPQEATPSIIRVVLIGPETLTVQGAPVELQHFRATTEDIQLEIWATGQGEIQRIEIPQANLEIVRQP